MFSKGASRACASTRLIAYLRSELRPEEWLIIEWPESEAEPTKYWLSTLPPDIPFDKLVDAVKLRWRIERDSQELKQEVGLGHYEGRGWRGFHHHATLCIAAYGFLVAEREANPPQDIPAPGNSEHLPFPIVHDPRHPPLRPERHAPNSIATLRRRIAPFSRKPSPDAHAPSAPDRDADL